MWELCLKFRKRVLSGFTLVEILIVVSILGILTAVIATNFGPTQQKGRDTKRRNDISAYRTALEAYASDAVNNGLYPVSTSPQAPDAAAVCARLSPTYIGTCPIDPRSSLSTYQYMTDASGTMYCLWNKLESKNKYFEACSDGRAGEVDRASLYFMSALPTPTGVPVPTVTITRAPTPRVTSTPMPFPTPTPTPGRGPFPTLGT